MSSARSLNALVEWFLPPALRSGSPDTVRRAKLCVAYNLAVPLWAPGFGILLWTLGYPLIGVIILGASLLTPLPLLVLRHTGSLVLTGNVIASIMSVVTVICTWLEGGLGAPGVFWFPLIPILAMRARSSTSMRASSSWGPSSSSSCRSRGCASSTGASRWSATGATPRSSGCSCSCSR